MEQTIALTPKYNKLTINTEHCSDKVEINLDDSYELVQESDGKWFAIKKKKEYPKTYEECINELDIHNTVATCAWEKEMKALQTLLVFSYAYWKIEVEEMGLDKPWEPQEGVIYCYMPNAPRCIRLMFPFPTAEMRDAFYENFKKEIEKCKKLL